MINIEVWIVYMANDNIPIRVAVTGVTGRMGKEIIQCIIQKTQKVLSSKIVLGAALARINSDVCGMDVGTVMKDNITTGIIITDNLNVVKNDFDTLIDFTVPSKSLEYLDFCVSNNKNVVIGTTGFNKDHQYFIKDISKKIGVVYSANFSIGMTVMLKVLHVITQVIGDFVDIDIIESHHNKKIDVPSGTALMMKDTIIRVLSSIFIKNTKKSQCFNENSKSIYYDRLSSYNNIPIHSIRAGDLVGEHSVLFAGIGESLQIIHKACNRAIFVDGALRSAIWLGFKKGLFNMCDVLGI